MIAQSFYSTKTYLTMVRTLWCFWSLVEYHNGLLEHWWYFCNFFTKHKCWRAQVHYGIIFLYVRAWQRKIFWDPWQVDILGSKNRVNMSILQILKTYCKAWCKNSTRVVFKAIIFLSQGRRGWYFGWYKSFFEKKFHFGGVEL